MKKLSTFITETDAAWLKGNLHCHSTYSDGNLEPKELIYTYKHHGYDFLSLTDHDKFISCQHLSDDQLTTLNGVEITCYTPNEKRIHINVLWQGINLNIIENKTFEINNWLQTKELLNRLKQSGCYIMLNHPHWSMLQSSDVLGCDCFHSVELYNYSTEFIENMGESSIFWEELLTAGIKLWGGGNDDNHNRSPVDSLCCDSFGGFTVVKAKNRTDKAILEALITGSFYTSTGPQIYDFYVENNIVHLLCSPCTRIIFNGNARQYQRIIGKYVTEYKTKLIGTETFIRAECMDAGGKIAFSNPIYLK